MAKGQKLAGRKSAPFKMSERQNVKSDVSQNNVAEMRRSGGMIMLQLIGLVKPLLHIMLTAIILGTAGYLCAIFLTILAGSAVLSAMQLSVPMLRGASIQQLLAVILILAVLRGILHYAEQYCNHFIAFKLLAIIRHKVFAALRKLCPAKLEGKDRGNLISIITTDIELLEVFYAHTISPIAIAVCTSLVMVLFLGLFSVLAAVYAACAYAVVGVLIPMWNGRMGGQKGMEYRNAFGELNSFVLSSLRGVEETLQYENGEDRRKEMVIRSRKLGVMQQELSHHEALQRSLTNGCILVASCGMLALLAWQYEHHIVDFAAVVIGTITMMGSFGPVVALANLSNNLNQTLASGERVLSILEEEPVVPEQLDGKVVLFAGAQMENVDFAYENERILKQFHMTITPGKMIGIHGSSGCGKSTVLKLLMRFWDVDAGEVQLSGQNIRDISTDCLRGMQSFVTQETEIFHDTIANNIALAKEGATKEEIVEAAKKASLHDFIMGLPQGYETQVGELGATLSGGERQRIGLARAFLHDAPFMLLDEPTSNLDSLNEGVILKSLRESGAGKTVLIVSHRLGTLKVAQQIVSFQSNAQQANKSV